MKRIKQYYNLVLSFIRHLVIGEHYYTELEVALLISKMQHEMAQEIIGNRIGCARIIPLNYYQNIIINKIGFSYGRVCKFGQCSL